MPPGEKEEGDEKDEGAGQDGGAAETVRDAEGIKPSGGGGNKYTKDQVTQEGTEPEEPQGQGAPSAQPSPSRFATPIHGTGLGENEIGSAQSASPEPVLAAGPQSNIDDGDLAAGRGVDRGSSGEIVTNCQEGDQSEPDDNGLADVTAGETEGGVRMGSIKPNPNPNRTMLRKETEEGRDEAVAKGAHHGNGMQGERGRDDRLEGPEPDELTNFKPGGGGLGSDADGGDFYGDVNSSEGETPVPDPIPILKEEGGSGMEETFHGFNRTATENDTHLATGEGMADPAEAFDDTVNGKRQGGEDGASYVGAIFPEQKGKGERKHNELSESAKAAVAAALAASKPNTPTRHRSKKKGHKDRSGGSRESRREKKKGSLSSREGARKSRSHKGRHSSSAGADEL
ncbi:unnamed protein product [Discosporangium mesarthrocarpum]